MNVHVQVTAPTLPLLSTAPLFTDCTDSSVFMDKIKDWENYYYSSPDVAFMTATEGGHCCCRLPSQATPAVSRQACKRD